MFFFYLTKEYGFDIVKDIITTHGDSGNTRAVIDQVLQDYNTSLSEEFINYSICNSYMNTNYNDVLDSGFTDGWVRKSGNQDYYDIPSSLINTIDLIKIYINGVYYDGEYTISDNGGIKGIKLLDYSALKIDPLYEYFNRYPEELEAYKVKYNKEYKRRIDKITFEWR